MGQAANKLSWICVLFGAVCCSEAAAQQPTIAAVPIARTALIAMSPAERWKPVSEGRLDVIRGGFDVGSGLLASFGLNRQIYVNGTRVSSASVQIPDIANMTREQAGALLAATGSASVVQLGPGNNIDATAFTQATAATVIQNTLDGQNIQSLTTLDIVVNNVDLLHGINLANSLQAAAISSQGH